MAFNKVQFIVNRISLCMVKHRAESISKMEEYKILEELSSSHVSTILKALKLIS
jgi:hypothetical protein